jgi:hypothetical protein
MTQQNNGGPAFPQNYGIEQLESPMPVQGMTLRDYFAAKAIQPLIHVTAESIDDPVYEIGLAKMAYRLADAMLEARNAT